ncbi:MAG: hypothetical protein JXR94_15475 [Candidatus Hydrogenedentes bacterium]|nr:hypothetical protein [Candidatus Hydrogenedentota bacterium]
MRTKWFALLAAVLCVPLLAGCPEEGAGDKEIDPTEIGGIAPKDVPLPPSPTPILYTFTGSVVSIEDDSAGAAAAAGVARRDPVTYTLLIGLNKIGYVVDNNGAIINFDDTADKDYFYTSFESGALMAMVDGGCYNAPTDLAQIHFGVNSALPGTEADPNGMLVGGSNNHSLVLSNITTTVDYWDFGAEVGASEEVHDAAGNTSRVYSWLELTGIEGYTPPDPPPPPDPTDGALLYTFYGSVFLVRDDSGAAAAALPDPIEAGSPVTYQIIVDLLGQAYLVDNEGETHLINDGVPFDYFLAQEYSGSLIDPIGTPYYAGNPLFYSEIAFGWSRTGVGIASLPLGRLVVGSSDNTIVIVKIDQAVASWTVGTQVAAVEETHSEGAGGLRVSTAVYSTLTLDSIVPYVAPAP